MKNSKGFSIFKIVFIAILICVLGYIAVNDISYTTTETIVGEDGTETTESVTKDAELSMSDIKLGLDLQGGVSIIYQPDIESPTAEDMNSAVRLLRGRLDDDGYTDAEVAIVGADRISVQIPGVDDPDEAIKELAVAGQLSFMDATGNVYLTGTDVKNASAQQTKDSNGIAQTVVQLEFTDEGKEKFANATESLIGSQLLICLDDEILSAPNVSERIYSNSAIITGSFTFEEANELAELINAGALPFRLNVISDNIVGAKLGIDALDTSLTAGLIGLCLVVLFMIFAYRFFGVIASVALAMFIFLEILCINVLNITLTLPGIAGIILTIGMAVDANIIIFERIKEDIKENKTLRVAVKSGFSRAFPAILDGNITTLLAALILYTVGDGPIKGFAQTLSIGIVLSMFTALVVTRTMINSFIIAGMKNTKYFGTLAIKDKIYDIIGKRKRVFISSAVVLIAFLSFGIFNYATGSGLFNYDIEFSGGTAVTIDIGQDFVNSDITDIVKETTGETNVQIQKIVGSDEVTVKLKEIDQDTRIAMVDAILENYGLTDESVIDISSISATVSTEMRNSAVLAVILSTIAILIYVSFRFKNLNTGISAILALVHDAMLVLMFYMAFRIPLNYSFIAVMLTVIGYSINSTIVIFDRVRENKNAIEMEGLEVDSVKLINESVSQTLNRSLFTSITTLITVVVLYVLGVSSIREFALPIIFGVLVGTYSSVCISGNLWCYFTDKGIFKKFEAEPEVKKIVPKRIKK
ncbi:MAG: protein translocase subunit SecD [Lachnospirales bacterium]